jgi:Spx/MgsR family transcriptional regulator
MITLYGIPNCDTVKKARAWLSAEGLEHEFYDFKKRGVPADRLPDWVQALGWEKLLNRQGTTWRKLDAAAQASVQDAASAQALMLANPSVIKRPVVEWPETKASVGGKISVGFDPKSWTKTGPNLLV